MYNDCAYELQRDCNTYLHVIFSMNCGCLSGFFANAFEMEGIGDHAVLVVGMNGVVFLWKVERRV